LLEGQGEKRTKTIDARVGDVGESGQSDKNREGKPMRDKYIELLEEQNRDLKEKLALERAKNRPSEETG